MEYQCRYHGNNLTDDRCIRCPSYAKFRQTAPSVNKNRIQNNIGNCTRYLCNGGKLGASGCLQQLFKNRKEYDSHY